MNTGGSAISDRTGKVLFLGSEAIPGLKVGTAEMIDALEQGFRDKCAGLTEFPPKPTIHPRPDCFLRALIGYLGRSDVAGLKWVAAYPTNRKQGLPLVVGLVLLSDPKTGFPLAIMAADWITAQRTAAVSAVAAKYLAPEGATELAICGAGIQGDIHLEFLSHVLPDLGRVRVFDPAPRALRAFLERHSSAEADFVLEEATDPRRAVAGADVIVTAAPMMDQPLAIIEADDLAPGVLCLPLDLDNYFAPSAFARCQKKFADDVEQFLSLKQQGHFAHVDRLDGGYGQLVGGLTEGRTDRSEPIMAISVGIALGDLIIADLLYRRALESGVGTWLEL